MIFSAVRPGACGRSFGRSAAVEGEWTSNPVRGRIFNDEVQEKDKIVKSIEQIQLLN